MLSSRRLGAFFSGVLLYCCAMLLSNPLALTPLPYQWLRVAGMPDSLPGQVWRAAVFALPIFLGACAWTYLSLKSRHRARQAAARWLFGGIALAWFGWLVYGVVEMSMRTQAHRGGAAALLLTSKLPPFWGLQNTLAVIGGALLALLLMPKSTHSGSGSRKAYRSGHSSFGAGHSGFADTQIGRSSEGKPSGSRGGKSSSRSRRRSSSSSSRAPQVTAPASASASASASAPSADSAPSALIELQPGATTGPAAV